MNRSCNMNIISLDFYTNVLQYSKQKSLLATRSGSSAAAVSTRRKLVRASSAASSSSAGSETRSWLVGRSGPACRRAPSVSACWWTHSSETRSQVQPAAASSRAFSSFWSSPVRSTKEHLETTEARHGNMGWKVSELRCSIKLWIYKTRIE